MEKDLNNELGKSERLGIDLNIDGVGSKHSNNRLTWIGWVRRSIHHLHRLPHRISQSLDRGGYRADLG